MVDEERVISMAKMSMFEKGKKRKCLKISSYYKRDYIVLQTIMTLLWSTLAYVIILAGVLALQAEELAYQLTTEVIIDMVIKIGESYLAVLIILGVSAVFGYGWKYKKALDISREYYRSLGRLSKEYKRES